MIHIQDLLRSSESNYYKMKKLLTLLIFLGMGVSVASAQKYFIQVDSFHFVTVKSGKTYKLKLEDNTKVSYTLNKIEGDSLYFNEGTYYFKEIKSIKNPKRKDVVDAIIFPITIGSCVGMSIFPFNYFTGYFFGETKDMLMASVIVAGETIIFYMARSYLRSNKRWIPISQMDNFGFSTQ